MSTKNTTTTGAASSAAAATINDSDMKSPTSKFILFDPHPCGWGYQIKVLNFWFNLQREDRTASRSSQF